MKSAWTDKGTRILLAIIAGLLFANLAGTLSGAGSAATPNAGLPDTAALMVQVVDETQKVNKNLEKLQAYLESGKLSVKVEKTDSK